MEHLVQFEGVQLKLKRTRYANEIFTWAWARDEAGRWKSLGDPWPCAHPASHELRAAIEERLGKSLVSIRDDLRERRFEEIKGLFQSFLRARELDTDGIVVYSPEEWRNGEGAAHGSEDMIAAVVVKDSPLFSIVNQTNADAPRLLEALIDYLESNGYAFEPMQSWAIGIYEA